VSGEAGSQIRREKTGAGWSLAGKEDLDGESDRTDQIFQKAVELLGSAAGSVCLTPAKIRAFQPVGGSVLWKKRRLGVHPMRILLSQHLHRVHLQRPPGRQPAGHEGDVEEEDRGSQVGGRVGGGHAVEQG
jgi:hypothetical protein